MKLSLMYSRPSRYVLNTPDAVAFQCQTSDQVDRTDHNWHIYPMFHLHDKSGWHSLFG